MKITSGIAKGHQLSVPRVKELRPTKNMVRQAIFSILGDVGNTVVLDLFAGSGVLGIESLSRNANWIDFVDNNELACFAIQKNLKHARFKGKAKIHHETVETFLLACPPNQYHLVFADPPYEMKISHVLATIPQKLKKDGVVVYLHHRDVIPEIITGLDHKETRQYGLTGVSFLTKTRT